MLRRNLYGIFAFVLACGILVVSFARLSSLTFAFSPVKPSPTPRPLKEIPSINYPIAYPGKVMQGSFLWPIEAAKDRVWYFLTKGHLKKAELALYFSDKRLTTSKLLFERNDPESGTSTLTKSQKYLEIALGEEGAARKSGEDTSVFLAKMATASLKHRELIEKNIIPKAPGEARPQIESVENYAKKVYLETTSVLKGMGKEVPNDPFEGQ